MPINSLEIDESCFMVQGTKFEVPKRFVVLEPVGSGAYGIVCAAEDQVSNEHIAIKKIESAFEHITFTKRLLRELRILRHLQHENIIDVQSLFLPGPKESFEDVYVISGLMETDLASILKSSQPLTEDHCQFFLYQILRGMKYVHSAQVLHRDLKPRNLLVNANCDLKICDFGLARVSFQDKDFQPSPMTEYVCTRWYRAPEVLCSWSDYTGAIDVWSIGCIFGEMLLRRPLYPGHNTQHQLQIIILSLGSPTSDELSGIYKDKCRRFIECLPHSQGMPFEVTFANAGGGNLELAVDFLKQVLVFDPAKRVTVARGLRHPLLAQLYCPEDEPSRPPLDTSDFEFERRKITTKALREELFLEVMHYYPERRQQYLQEQMSLGQMYNIGNYRLLVSGESQVSSDDESDP